MLHNTSIHSLLRPLLNFGHDIKPVAGILVIAALFTGSFAPAAVRADDPLMCFVSILPQAYFVERIGGEYVEVHVMVGPGQSPATYEPTTRQLSLLAGSDVYFSIGVSFEESLLPRIERIFQDVPVVDTSRRIHFRSIVDHVHTDAVSTPEPSSPDTIDAPSHNHRAGMPDPHIWLSPRLAVTIAENIRDALVTLDSRHAETYTANCDRFSRELEDIDRRIAATLSPLRGRKVFVFHPAFGYFTDAYGLVQIAIETDGSTPGPKHLAAFIERARQEGVTTIFIQREFSTTMAEAVAAEIGAEVVQLDPLAGDYMNNLLRMAEKIHAALETGDALGAHP